MGGSGTDPTVRPKQASAPSLGMAGPLRQRSQIIGSVASHWMRSLLLAGALATLLLAAVLAAERTVNQANTEITAPLVQQARRGPLADASIPPDPAAANQPGDEAGLQARRVGPRALVEGTAIDARPDTSWALYRVRTGDTLLQIARSYGISADDLAAINSLRHPERLAIGQTLLVPPVVAGDEPSIDKGVMASSSGQSQSAVNSAASEEPAVSKAEPSQPASSAPPLKADRSQAAPEQAVAQEALTGKRERPAPTARGGRRLATWEADFIIDASEAARVAQEATGVPASVTIAQAILESDWGRATIGANNYFGIKATTKPGPAGVVWALTKEYTAKGWITIRAPFRAYENMAQSFIDHGLFFLENSRYAEALRNAGDPKAFARLIQAAGYATDPKYAQSLIRLMDDFDLYQYDLPVTASAATSQSQPASSDASAPLDGPAGQEVPAAPPTIPPASATPLPAAQPAGATPVPALAPAAVRGAVEARTGRGAEEQPPTLTVNDRVKMGLGSSVSSGKIPTRTLHDWESPEDAAQEGPAPTLRSVLEQGADLLLKLRP